MPVDSELFVGRSAELAVGERAVARALAGDGTLLLLSGEAGVGKTRAAQAIAAIATQRGARVAWGRAWESGGAPSYWPWIQAFRALGASPEPFAAEGHDDELEGAQARFATFDRAARWLVDAARDTAITIVLDDLHAADVSSLLFLQFLARDVHRSRLLVVVTFRDVEAQLAGEVGTLLAKVAREGTTLALDPLSQEDVLAWVCAATGTDAGAAQADAERIHAVTEGNALFIHELIRVRGASSPALAAKLPGLRAILDEHVARLSNDAREVVQVCSVLGREIDPQLAERLSGRTRDHVEHALREACDVGLLVENERLSFAHILLRERLYAELPPARRAELHGIAGEAIVAAGADLATAVHHLFVSSVPHERIGEIARDAAHAALARLAFEEAARLCERALSLHEADDALAFELELARGEALLRAGASERGREVCMHAVARAKRLGSAERLAQAALALATEQASGSVDPSMVATLREALQALPVADTSLRARVLARLAASLMPPRSNADATAARTHGADAIALARRLGDRDTLIYTLHHAGIGLGYVLSLAQRDEVLSELYDVATVLRRPLVKLHVGGWRVAILREQGRLAEANAALEDYTRLVEEAPWPHYRWRLPMMHATLAALGGDFDVAERLAADGLAIAEEGAVAAGRMAWVLCRLSIAQLRGDVTSVVRDADRLEAISGRVPPARAWLYAATGRADQARPIVEHMARGTSYFSWALFFAEVACLLSDTELAARAYESLRPHAEQSALFWGPSGVVMFGHAQRAAGDLASMLGRDDEARRWYDAARALGERMQAPALVAAATRGRPAIASDASPRPAIVTHASPRPNEHGISNIELRRDGELWRISSSTGVTASLKDSKGLLYLSYLLARPRQELHVTQLADISDVPSDAGTVLDARAKAQYKRRLEDLRDQLEEARGFGDFTRAERVQAEIESIAEQLAAAVGLGGRDRKVGSHAERARINIQRRIKDAIERIGEHDPALGRYLAATVKTGMFCMFLPV